MPGTTAPPKMLIPFRAGPGGPEARQEVTGCQGRRHGPPYIVGRIARHRPPKGARMVRWGEPLQEPIAQRRPGAIVAFPAHDKPQPF